MNSELRATELSRLPEVSPEEPGLQLVGYDQDNPPRVVRVSAAGFGGGIPASEKGAPGGVAELDENGLNAQPPKLHAATHEPGGSDPLTSYATKNGEGTNYIVVDVSAGDPLINGMNLLAAYAAARLLTPNGAALSAANRAVVLVPPGKYDLGTTPLTLDTQFVDVVGVSGDPKHVLITSAVDAENSGTIVQSADDVRVRAVTVRNTADTRNSYDSSDASAYAPQGAYAMTVWEDVVFDDGSSSWSMRPGMEYSGTFINCTGGVNAFGGGSGTASGTFTNCTGGDFAFGGGSGSGTASGTFTSCTGGDSAFGGYSTASGTFINCMGGNYSFGGGNGGTASGTFTGCTGGDYAFGGNGGDISYASGTFTNCTGGDYAFGGDGGVASGTFTNCTGGDYAFGGFDGIGGTITGKLYFCRLTSGSFATVSGSGITRYCLDGSNTANNQG